MNNIKISLTDCTDTPLWDDGAFGEDCNTYRTYWCERNAMKPEYEFMFGSKSNYPEKNCCGCGKYSGFYPGIYKHIVYAFAGLIIFKADDVHIIFKSYIQEYH